MPCNNTHYDVFLKGNHIDLIGLTEEIVEQSNWYSWFNDEETTQYIQKHYYPNSVNLQRKYLNEEVIGNPSRIQLGILHKADQVMIGVISLNNIDHVNRKCELAGLIGEKKYKSVSFWLEANRLLIAHAVNVLNLRRVAGGSISKELATFYQRMLGFKHEGILVQDAFKNGIYHDSHLFARIFDAPFEFDAPNE